MDDGTPIMDTGKCTFDTTNDNNQIICLISSTTTGSGAPLGNTYINFSKKILINSTAYSGSADNTNNTAVSGVTFVYGTAGGNSVNENHHSRPEFLSALFQDAGIAYAKRFSSSTSTVNFYIANRFGLSSEENLGTIRLNVPFYYA